MAEHDERNFEHEISEKLKALDKNIKIPEIPDAQSIFEKAEAKKENTVPFRRYSKYVAAAAAVVLICVSLPVMSDALSSRFSAESAYDAEGYAYSIFDEADDNGAYQQESIEEYTNDAEPEEAEEPGTEASVWPASSSSSSSSDEMKEAQQNGAIEKNKLEYALTDYFSANSSAAQSGTSSDRINENDAVGDDLSFIEDYINKKRSIEITVEKDSVSVLLRDNSAEEEMIAAFWIEGCYEGSYLDGDYYVINLLYYITEEDFESGYYLPMVGDAYGTYYISEEDVFSSEEITKGAVALAVEINVGTGEYKIYASLV